MTGYLGLGSNVGDRRAHLQAAVELLPAGGVTVFASSSVYETEPVGEVRDQRAFFNACVAIETDLEPEALLDACKAVERERGRAPGGVRHGPRPLDVDVLMLGSLEYHSERLTIPHPQIAARAFVRVPLSEVGNFMVLFGNEAPDDGAVELIGPPLILP